MEKINSNPCNDAECDSDNLPTKDYKKKLCTDIKKVESEKKGKKTQYESKQDDYQYRVCSVIKTERVNAKYKSIDNCIATAVLEDMKIINTNLDTYEKSYKNLNDTLFKGVKDGVKDIKKKVLELDACGLNDCINGSCNTEQKKKLCQITNFDQKVLEISNRVRKCRTNADKLFLDTAVISGVQTFASIDGLKEFGKRLNTAIENFKKDIDTNIKSTNEEVIVAQTDLTKTIQAISKSKYEYYAKCLSLEGMIDTRKFICDPVLQCKDIDCICNCGSPAGNDSNPCPPKPRYFN